ncbi:uncharacterized protein CANTADRAFT_46867 [Suhomyces tanzawaensis NRRL Y-17324]|uniref:Uncharacterized protein n=1 Tax=Suhomyces tanzawaensis NRRL Y-17324 TaxID=984487 RepID=A0A1E4SM34_9ASCO|nr:uncharacterized protein CANTADRAFT_46867 [Suhomyces tanzawaensis NRRL Y-17324]ODV80548.1 hypothetical protein CANTADRAFT_46867 [Suhomyces tanzawaensis NRRL Y-17324]
MPLPSLPLGIDLHTVVITVVAVVVIDYIYSQYIESTKDVNDLYLSDQSLIEATRLPNESAIYKSNKLDHSHGLRIGLDIRYDHYKVRHGNLCDIWQIVMDNASNTSNLNIDNQPLLLHALNHRIARLGDYLRANSITSIKINVRFFLVNQDVFVAIFAGFLNQVTVEFYDDITNLPANAEDLNNSLIVVDDSEQAYIHETTATFDNEYNFTKDKGIALKITRKINNKVLSTIEFTQLNLISAVASTLKHLPLTKVVDSNDSFLIINDALASNDHMLNNLTKLMTGFISNSQITLLNKPLDAVISWDTIFDLNPTIVSVSEARLAKMPIDSYLDQLSWYTKFFFNQKLIYVNKSLKNSPEIPMSKYNTMRCLFSTRVIVESGYYNIIGPVILTDFYDYRLNNVSNLKSFGCISQAMEIKLINVNAKNVGNIMVRGYNIGKTTTWLVGTSNETTEANLLGESLLRHDQNKLFMNQNNGFMTLNDSTGIWGNDGCLYVV